MSFINMFTVKVKVYLPCGDGCSDLCRRHWRYANFHPMVELLFDQIEAYDEKQALWAARKLARLEHPVSRIETYLIQTIQYVPWRGRRRSA